MPGWSFKSRDEERRRLRCHVATLQRAAESQKQARLKIEKEKKCLEAEIKALQEKNKVLEVENTELLRQRDMYRNMVFKANKENNNKVDPKKDDLADTLKELEDRKGKKKRGRKKGHLGSGRKKPEHIDEIKRSYLSHCPDCHKPLGRRDQTHCHVVEDLPDLGSFKPTSTCYEIEEQWCLHCRKKQRANPPNVIPHSRLGIHIILVVLMLRFRSKSSIPAIKDFLEHVFQLKVSCATVINIMNRAKVWFGPFYDSLLNEIRCSPVKHADETTWRVDGINHWLWGFMTQKAIYYYVDESRGKGVPQTIFKDCHKDDVLVRDDYGAYTNILMIHQSCWAHLLRVSHEWASQDKVSSDMTALHQELKLYFDDLSKVVNSSFDEKERKKQHLIFKNKLQVIQDRIYQDEDVKKVQTRIKNQGDRLITAILYENVPLTNNFAERQLRPFVVMRKMSGGSRSVNGAETTAVLMSTIVSIKEKGQPLVESMKKLILESLRNKN